MNRINQNDLATKITIAEAGKTNTNIAQVKEVLRLTLLELNREWHSGNKVAVMSLIRNFK